MENYYKQLAAMPEEIRAISEQIWDCTGRPVVDFPLEHAAIALLDLCNNYEEFRTKYAQLFPNQDIDDAELKDRMSKQWAFYTAGLKRGASDMANRLTARFASR